MSGLASGSRWREKKLKTIHFALILTLCGLAVSCSTSKCLPYRYETVSRTIDDMYPPPHHNPTAKQDIKPPVTDVEPAIPPITTSPLTDVSPSAAITTRTVQFHNYYRTNKEIDNSGGSTFTVKEIIPENNIRSWPTEQITTISIHPQKNKTKISVKSTNVPGLFLRRRDLDYELSRLRDIETELKRRHPQTP
ncbi:MAG: hypothetical protein V1809_07780 [Planctomycetota bacterium]